VSSSSRHCHRRHHYQGAIVIIKTRHCHQWHHRQGVVGVIVGEGIIVIVGIVINVHVFGRYSMEERS